MANDFFTLEEFHDDLEFTYEDYMPEDDLHDWFEGDGFDNVVGEMADFCIPGCFYKLMELCADPAIFTRDASEFGPPKTLLQAAQYTVYSYASEWLYEEHSRRKEEWLESCRE